MSKRSLLVLGITLLATTSAYAGYTFSTFNKDGMYNTSLDDTKNSIKNLTDKLTTTATKLEGEKHDRSSDISQLNGEIDQANKYASSVASAVADANSTSSKASSAISTANSAISYDPSTVSSSAN
ncbi:hypothetical protein [Weissella confusa]|uniref:hypothetical protein n=1 Tax=Weissella confusa TaxID=1583 RepID=UPI0013DF1771|nr:hypothetical protein [Weissella confusa]QIE79845.1 hypothetical protein G4V46_11510 [Weissella confusa]